MKRRILLVGTGHPAAPGVQGALEAADWAAVPWSGAPGSIAPSDLDGIDAVFNGTLGSPRAILANAGALQRALQRSGSTARVVHLSSMTVYGGQTGVLAEDAELRADLGAYGAAQIEAEALLQRHPHSVILRPGCEYGPGCVVWTERIARLLMSRRLGDLGAHGDGICNLLFVDDLVEAVLGALRLPGIEGRRFNLAMPEPPTWNGYFTQFGRALGAVPIARIPGRRLRLETRLLAPPLKVLERLPGLSKVVVPALTPSLLRLCGQTLTLDSRAAGASLGIGWTPLAAGLRQAALALGRDHSTGRISTRRNSMG